MRRFLFPLPLLGLALPSLALAASVQLAWDYPATTPPGGTPAVGFLLERCTIVPPAGSCTAYATITPSPIPVALRTYTDTTVVGATGYGWRLRATDAQGGMSAYSNAVMFQIPPDQVAAPTNLRGTVVP